MYGITEAIANISAFQLRDIHSPAMFLKNVVEGSVTGLYGSKIVYGQNEVAGPLTKVLYLSGRMHMEQ